MHHLIGKLLESILGKEVMLRLSGGITALLGGLWLIVCILSIRESLRRRRTQEPAPLSVVRNDPGRMLSDPAIVQHAPIWKEFVSLAFAAALAVMGIWLLLRPDHRSGEERASAEIKRLKGEVTVDEKAPGRPIVKVSFREYLVSLSPPRRLTDSDLASLKPHLEALPQLRELDLCRTDITDRGLSELRGLTQLKTLILGSDLYPTPLTEDGVSEIRKALPNTEICFYKSDVHAIDPRALK
jgi:hypothetical protein